MPVWAFEFKTTKPPEHLLTVLRGNTGGVGTALSYSGWVWDTHFLVTKTLNYINSGSPILAGRVSGLGGGSSVCVVLTLHPIFWILLLTFTWFSIASPVLVGFAWALVVGGFAAETGKATRDLRWSMGLEVPTEPAA
jgi:hypothetical protein